MQTSGKVDREIDRWIDRHLPNEALFLPSQAISFYFLPHTFSLSLSLSLPLALFLQSLSIFKSITFLLCLEYIYIVICFLSLINNKLRGRAFGPSDWHPGGQRLMPIILEGCFFFFSCFIIYNLFFLHYSLNYF